MEDTGPGLLTSRPRLVSALLTAAGESIRMGRPKSLLQWQGVPLVRYQVDSLLRGGVDEVVVVLGHRHEGIVSHLQDSGVMWVLNSCYKAGRTTSIKAGLMALNAKTDTILLLGVDQPRPPDIVNAVLKAHDVSGALITSPRHKGLGGHPVIFAATLASELERISEECQGIRAVYEAHREEVNNVEMDEPILRLDLNTPEDYQFAFARYGRI